MSAADTGSRDVNVRLDADDVRLLVRLRARLEIDDGPFATSVTRAEVMRRGMRELARKLGVK